MEGAHSEKEKALGSANSATRRARNGEVVLSRANLADSGWLYGKQCLSFVKGEEGTLSPWLHMSKTSRCWRLLD